MVAASFLACSASAPGGGAGDSDSDGNSDIDGGGDADGFEDDDGNIGDDGSSSGTGGSGTDCGSSSLQVIFRDFKGASEEGGHPDFERPDNNGQNEVGCKIVAVDLGADFKPTFAQGWGLEKREVTNEGGVLTFSRCVPWDWTPAAAVISAETFDTWYRTTEGTNVAIESVLEMHEEVVDSGIYVFDSGASGFFPLDGQGFGNTPGQAHNFSFTTEAHAKFGYTSGQKFTFRGDDDLWVFVNGKLALDLGGMHGPIEATLDFDAQASALGISPGNSYRMDIFHAERHTSDSNFRVETNIKCFTPVPSVN